MKMSEPERVEPVEYDSPFPECRVLATADPYAMIRLDMDRGKAALLAKRIQYLIDHHDKHCPRPDDELITLGITLTEPTYKVFADQVEKLVNVTEEGTGRTDEPLATQVVIERDLEPDDPDGISVAVLLNKSQLYDVYGNSQVALAMSNGNLHRWEFSTSRNGAVMLVQQLTAAVNGAENPLEHVDVEEVGPDE